MYYTLACKGAEFIVTKSPLLVQKLTNVLVETDSVTYFRFQFPPLVCFYTVLEVKRLPIVDSKLSSHKLSSTHNANELGSCALPTSFHADSE